LITNNPYFQNWFKGSKVVDENGNPLRVYHGSPHEFQRFNTSPKKYEHKNAVNLGAYFTADTYIANDFSDFDGKWSSGRVYPVYLSIKNPINISHITHLKGLYEDYRKELANSLPLLTNHEKENIINGMWGNTQYQILEGLA
jgi:hypothetical protein